MYIERPPLVYRLLYPAAVWRTARRDAQGRPTVYLTFDDGPVPEATPAVLDILQRHDIKATFFMVADNARRHPELLERVRREGHAVGNHTFHHLRGHATSTSTYIADVRLAADVLGECAFFRPPHGLLKPAQCRAIGRAGFKVVMHDVLTRDYSVRLTADDVVRNVERYTRPGSIIVFHDSERAAANCLGALERCITLLRRRGYTFSLL